MYQSDRVYILNLHVVSQISSMKNVSRFVCKVFIFFIYVLIQQTFIGHCAKVIKYEQSIAPGAMSNRGK